MSGVRLVVFMEPKDEEFIRAGGKFKCESEQTAAKIIEFCRSKDKFAYKRTFVSIAIIKSNEDVCQSRATIYGNDPSSLLGKTHLAVLKPVESVLAKIEVAARDDFLQLATDIANRWKRGELFDSLLRMLKDLRKLTFEQKKSALAWATKKRGNHGYSETRLHRALTEDDVARWGRCD